MKSAFNTDIVRSIRSSLGRFIAIAGIVALGCGFYAGLRMTAPDMDLAADEYYDQANLMDIRVVSTLGLTQADIDAISKIDGVGKVAGEFEADAMVTLDDEQYVVRIHSLPYGSSNASEWGESRISEEMSASLNALTLLSGRWPTAVDECIISADNVMSSPVELGDVIRLDEGVSDIDEMFDAREYKIVGFARSPYYVATTAMGSTSLGSGSIDQFMYVPRNAFDSDLPFTEAFVEVIGAKELMSGSFDYQSKIDEVIKELHGIAAEREQARYAQVKREAQEKLDESRAEYEAERADALSQLNDAKRKLDDASETIAKSREKVRSGQAEYGSGLSELAKQRSDAQAQLEEAQAQIEREAKKLEESKVTLDAAASRLDAGWASAGVSPQDAPNQLEHMKAQLELMNPDDPSQAAQYAALKAAIDGLEKLLSSQAEYDAGKAAYDAGEAQLRSAQQELDQKRSSANDRFASAESQLAAAARELSSGRAQLASGESEYADGLSEYEEERARAQREFADAEKKLDDAQSDIDSIEMPEWLIMDRTKNPGTVSFESDADRVDSIAAFFPFIFFLVAALVALTTMTRMVEEERILIGTFKALGYSRSRITSKYLIYAATASIAGSIIGIVALSLILPPVIMEAYAIIYDVPHHLIMPIDAWIALSSAALGVGVTLFATWAAVASTLRETPAQLMLPRAPKEGKRILLERVGFVWRRMTFSWKVTLRNIFRYKKRLVMTVIGIAGCTGLLLTGLGLQDSINDIIDKQYGQTVLYNVHVTGEDDRSGSSREALDELSGHDAFAQVESMRASGPDKSNVSISVVVPEDSSEFQELWIMRTRVGQQPIELGDDGVVITEKLSNMLGVGVGGDITLAEQDAMGNATTTTYDLRVTGVMENYVANYAFLGHAIFEDAFEAEPDFTSMFAAVEDGGDTHQAFREAAESIEGVKTVAFNNETIDTYRKMLRSVNMIVVVLVVAAAALAFIVLYNLTNINITERQREIATLKVLGFTPHEVDMYIYRETILLTILGALVGLVFGIFLEGFVIVSAEVDYVMFGRDIHALSFVVAFIVTIVFALAVMVFMRGKLAKVDMIESLKSNE